MHRMQGQELKNENEKFKEKGSFVKYFGLNSLNIRPNVMRYKIENIL